MTRPGDHAVRFIQRLYWRFAWIVGAYSLRAWLLADKTA